MVAIVYSKTCPKTVLDVANCVDPDQTQHSAASDLGIHCLPITVLAQNSVCSKPFTCRPYSDAKF